MTRHGGPVAVVIVVVTAITACAPATAPSMTPLRIQSAAERERDRAECEAYARGRAPSRLQPLREMLLVQGLGVAIGAVAGGVAVGARRGQPQGSVGPNATTDLLIIGSVAALGLVVGTLVGLVRAEDTREEGARIFAKVFADCMMERGYR